MTIEESADTGFLDVDRSIVIDPATDRILTLRRAVDAGIFDLHTGNASFNRYLLVNSVQKKSNMVLGPYSI